MLQIIRDKTTGWIAVAIVTILIIPFAFWGINYYFTGGQEPVIASVNGEDIKLSQFQRTYSNYRLQMQNLLGKTLGPEDEEFLKQQTLNKMVESELLNQVTQSERLRVSNEQVKATIKSIDVFQDDDGFNRDYYEQSIMRLGMPPAQYEEQMRLDMMSEQLQSAVIESEFVSGREAEYVARLSNQKRDLTYTIIPVNRFRDSIEVSDADIEKFYKENPRLYTSPEQVRIAYIELSLDKLAENIEVNEEDLRAFYEANKTDYESEEQRKVTQILFKSEEESATEDEKKAARMQAEEILAEIREGKTFEDIAKEYADNKNTNFSISEYGFLAKGILQEEVDEIAYTMQIGDISDVIQSSLGFHIIKLEDIKGGIMNTFENSRENAENDYRYKQAEQRFFDLADQLATLAYEHSDTLDIASEDTGLEIQESDFFSREGTEEGMTANPTVISASFTDDVLANRHNSEMLELSDRQLLVLRVIDHKPQAVRPLEEVKEDVKDDIRFAEASNKVHELGQQVITDLQAGKDMATITEETEIKWENVTDITRDDISVNRSVLRNAFSLGIPQDNKPVIGGLSLGTGDYAVIVVQAVKDPGPDSIKDDEIEKIRAQLFASKAASVWQQYLDELKAGAKIVLYKDRIQ